jgi:hypothetical protein
MKTTKAATIFSILWSSLSHRGDYSATSVESTTARLCGFMTDFTSVMPRTLRSLSSATFIGPGPLAVPGAGCGKAVDMAVWNVTLPSTFCIT